MFFFSQLFYCHARVPRSHLVTVFGRLTPKKREYILWSGVHLRFYILLTFIIEILLGFNCLWWLKSIQIAPFRGIYTISSVSFRIFSLSRKYSILTFHSVYQQIFLLLFACICVVGIWNPFSGSIEFAWNIVLLTYFIAIAFIFLYHFIFYDLYGKKTNRKAQTLLNGVWWCILLFYWIKW